MLYYRSNIKSLARALRREMTPEEKHLWYDFLKHSPYRFKRQKPIGNYILDFYCARAKLAIEIDGSQHYENGGLLYDERRTQYLETYGIVVLRFTNRDIHQSFDEVVTSIEQCLKTRCGIGQGR